MTALYDVQLVRPDKARVRSIGVAFAVRQRGPSGNWFPGAQDIMTPDSDHIRNCLPRSLWPAWDRGTKAFWHTSDTLHASLTLLGSRGKVLATIRCEGYER